MDCSFSLPLLITQLCHVNLPACKVLLLIFVKLTPWDEAFSMVKIARFLIEEIIMINIISFRCEISSIAHIRRL